MRICRFALAIGLAWILFLLGHLSVNAQSIEDRYDAALAAYNSTLNQLEVCDQNFADFQQFFKEQRPPEGSPKEDWDIWAKAYRGWVDLFTGCMRNLKKKAEILRKKLEELEKQLGSSGSDGESNPPREESDDKGKKKAEDFVNKGNEDLGEWTINVRFKIGQINDWSKNASEDVDQNGSGREKVEPRFQYDF